MAGYKIYNSKQQLVGTYEQPAKKNHTIIIGTMQQNGYIQSYVIDKAQPLMQLPFVEIDIDIPPAKPNLGGSIANDLELTTYGECLWPVCVPSSYTGPPIRDYRSDGSIWEQVCTTTYENCEDQGTKDCGDFYMISGPADFPYTDIIQVEDGCNTCWVTVTYHTDGVTSDEYSEPYGCTEIPGCNNQPPVPSDNDTAINNLDTLPCAKNIADSIMQLDPTSSFGQLINNLLNMGGSGFDVNITFNFKEMSDVLESGNTTGSGSTGHQNNNINLNTILMNSSQEFIAATLLHELMHAYLRTINTYAMSYPSYTNPILDSINYLRSQGYSGEALSHEAIARYFIDDMINALTHLFPSLQPEDALSLAWGGLSETSGWNNKSEEERQSILLFNQKEKFNQPGAKGTFCR